MSCGVLGNGYLNKTKNPLTLVNPFKRTKGSHAPYETQPNKYSGAADVSGKQRCVFRSD